jgi:ADP-ribosylglycohydrolase
MYGLLDRIYGCLIGGAIGDAMAAPAEDWHYSDIRAKFGRIDTFLPQPARKRDGQPGQITDDTTLRHYMCLAIIERGGRITPDDYADVWLNRLNPARLFATEGIVLQKLKLGMSPWDTGRGQPAADAAIMAVAPIGIVNIGDPRQAYQDAVNISSIHQDGLERDAAGAIAAGIAVALMPDATVETVLDTMMRHGTFDTRRLLTIARELSGESQSIDDFIERFYRGYLDRSFPRPPDWKWDKDRTVSPTSREVLPLVAGLFQLTRGQPRDAIPAAASAGRDADTIGTVIGGLAGALKGARSIPQEWILQSEEANRDFFDEVSPGAGTNFLTTARDLVRVLAAEQSKTAERAAQLSELIDCGEGEAEGGSS